VRESKNQVKVSYRKQFCFAGFKPFCLCDALAFWTVSVSARVVGVFLKSTGVALFNMATEIRSAAYFNQMHDFQMG
jgi:hypothetical protein